MSFARVRALVVVGLLAVIALVFVVVALVRDTPEQGGHGRRAARGLAAGRRDRCPSAKDVKINVYNGTDEAGLAGSVADDFRTASSRSRRRGNAPQGRSTSVAMLRYGPKAVGSAHLLRAYFLNDAELEFDLKRTDDTVDVVLGNSFQQLATTTEVNQSLGDLGSPVAPPGTCPHAGDDVARPQRPLAPRPAGGGHGARAGQGPPVGVQGGQPGRAAAPSSAGGAATTMSGPAAGPPGR